MADAHEVAPTHFVYVIGHDIGPQKVGFSNDPAYRARALKVTGEPQYKVHYAHLVEAAVVREVEKLAHWLLGDRTLGYERFDVTPAVAEQAVRDAVTWHAAGQRAPERDPATLVNVSKSIVLPANLWERIYEWQKRQPGKPMSLSKVVRTLVSDQIAREG